MSKEKKPNDGSTRTVTCGNTTLTLSKRDGQVSQVLADISRELSTYLNNVKSGNQQLNNLASSLAIGSREVLSVTDKTTLNAALQMCLDLEKNGNPKTKDGATKVLNTICCRMFGKGFSDTGQFLASALSALVYAGYPTTIYTACTSDTAAAIGLLLPPFSFFCRKNGKSWDKYFLLIDFQIARYLSLKSASLKMDGENKFFKTINISPSPLGMSIFTKYSDMNSTNGLNMMLMDIRDLKRKLQRFAVSNYPKSSDEILEMNESSLIVFFRGLNKSFIGPSYDAIINDVSYLEQLYNLCQQIQASIFVGDNEYNISNAYDEANIGSVFDIPIWLLELFISKYKTQIYSKKSEEQFKREALRAGIIDCLKGHDFGLEAVSLYKRDFYNLFTPGEWKFLEDSGSGDDVVLEFADTFIGSASCLVNSKDVLTSGSLKCKFNSLKEKIYVDQVVGRSDISSKSDGSDIISCVPGVNKIVVSQDFTSTKTFGEDAHAMQLQNAIQLVDKYFEKTIPSQQSCSDFISKNKNKMIPFIVVLKSKEEDYDSANTGIRLGMLQSDDVDTSIKMNFTSEPPPPIHISAFDVVTNGPASGLPDPVEVYLKMVFNNMHTSVFPEQWTTSLVPFQSSSQDDNIWFSECLQQIILDTKNDAISGLSVVKQKALLKQIIKSANLSVASSKKNSASSKKNSASSKKGIPTATIEEATIESPFDIYFKEWKQICPNQVNDLKTLIEKISQVTDDQIKKDPNGILLDFINKFTGLLNAANLVDDDRRSESVKCVRDRISSPVCSELTSSCALLTEISGSDRRDVFNNSLDVSDLLKSDDTGAPPQKRGRTPTSDADPSCVPDKTFTTAVLGFFTSIVGNMPTKEEAQINHQNKETPLIKKNNHEVETDYLKKMKESGITTDAMQTSFEKCLLILKSRGNTESSLALEISELSTNTFRANRISHIIYDIKKLLPKSPSFLDFAKAVLGIIHDENNFGPIDEIYNALGIINYSTREVFLIIWLFNIFFPIRADQISPNNVDQLLKGIDKENIERNGFVDMLAIDIELENEFSFLSSIVNSEINETRDQISIQSEIRGIILYIMHRGNAKLIENIIRKVECPGLDDLPRCLYDYILKERRNTSLQRSPLKIKRSTSAPEISSQRLSFMSEPEFPSQSLSFMPEPEFSSQSLSFMPQGYPLEKPLLKRTSSLPQGPPPGFQALPIHSRTLFKNSQFSNISQEQVLARELAQKAEQQQARKLEEEERLAQELAEKEKRRVTQQGEKQTALLRANERRASAIGDLLEAKRQNNIEMIDLAEKALREAIINMSRLQIGNLPENIPIEEQNETLMFLMDEIDDLNKVSDVFNALMIQYNQDNISNKGNKRTGQMSFLDMAKNYVDGEKNESPRKYTKAASFSPVDEALNSPVDEALNIAAERYPNSPYLEDEIIKKCLSLILDLIKTGNYATDEQLKKKINQLILSNNLKQAQAKFLLYTLLYYYQSLNNQRITNVISYIIGNYSNFGGGRFTRGRQVKVKRSTKGRKLSNQKRNTRKTYRKKNKTRRH
jgi:hypothetical protein